MVLLQKRSYKTVADVGTDPMDGDALVPPLKHEAAVVGSVIDASSVGDYHLTGHTGASGGVTVRRHVSHTCEICKMPHGFGNSRAIRDHTALLAIRQR